MRTDVPVLVALAAVPAAVTLARHRPRLVCGIALAACALPFLLSTETPIVRGGAALLTWLMLVKALQYAAGHERPPGALDFLQFIVMPVVVRWQSPRRPDRARAARSLRTGVRQLGLLVLLAALVVWLDLRSPVELATTQLGLYLGLAAVANLAVISLSLRGLDYDEPFDNPLVSRTPSELWGRRWNTWVSHVLHRYVFLPSGGRRHPVLGTMAAFAVSGAFHEAIVAAGTAIFTGWMMGYFVVQGAFVVATSRSRAVRRLARRAPAVAWVATMVVMFATGAMLVRGAEGVDPSHAWRRCCR